MFDVAVVTQPISAAQPSGIDLRLAQLADHPLDRVKQERFQEDPLTLPPGTEPRKVNWGQVIELCRALLTRHSKDLEAVAYLTEALTYKAGLDGLARGLEIASAVVGQFWPTLHPGAPSADDPEPMAALRAKWMSWIGGSADLMQAMRTVGLGFANAEGTPMTVGDLLDSQRLQRAYTENASEYQRLVEAKLTTPDAWRAAITQAGPERLTAAAEKAETCRQKLAELLQTCNQVFPGDVQPGFGKLEDLLENLAKELRSPAEAAGGEAPTEEAAAAGGGGATRAGVATPGSLATREDAVRTLQSVVRFLRQTEPHSPVPYMLERCARWLSMDFDQLMFDLTKDEGFMSNLREKLGIQPPNAG